ncbi:hypothetical protein Hanom_Chr06g00573551 [Helianthus anomalus]
MGDWEPECLEEFVDELCVDSNSKGDSGVEVDGYNNCGPVQLEEIILQETVEVVNEQNLDDCRTADRCPQVGDDGGVEVNVEASEVNSQGTCSRATKRKGYRKKVRSQKSPSSLGHDRPKKRARDAEDIFDIDRLIFAVNSEEARRVHSRGVQNNPSEFLTPDLNGDVEEASKLVDMVLNTWCGRV